MVKRSRSKKKPSKKETERLQHVHTLKDCLHANLRVKGTDQWIELCMRHLESFQSNEEAVHAAKCIAHYATVEDMTLNRVRTRPEEEYVNSLYRAKTRPRKMCRQPYHLESEGVESEDDEPIRKKLRTPAETFGRDVKKMQCNRCGSYETRTEDIQKRSADEPTSFKFNCLKCPNHYLQHA